MNIIIIDYVRNRELCSTVDTGYKNTLGSSNIGSFNRYVLITGVNYTVDMITVFQRWFLYPECSFIRCSYNRYLLYISVFTNICGGSDP